MKNLILLPTIAMMSFGLFSVEVSARGRSTTTTTTTTTSVTTASPRPTTNTSTQPPRTNNSNNNNATRPGASTGTSKPGNQPGNPPGMNQGNNNRPGNQPGNPPGMNQGNNNRPGNNNNNYWPNTPGFRPGTNPGNVPPVVNPPVNNRPNGYMPNYNTTPPRPNTPPSYVYNRPTPPSSWRPSNSSFRLSSILGVALGTVISNSVNSLINSGYYVSGYNSNEVYLNDVNYFNMNWPNATLYYNRGYLEGSLFSAATPSFDMVRYNYLYNQLTAQYGRPVTSNTLSNGGMTCTWWGYGNNYITLSFYPEYIYGSGTYYFTTLAVGN